MARTRGQQVSGGQVCGARGLPPEGEHPRLGAHQPRQGASEAASRPAGEAQPAFPAHSRVRAGLPPTLHPFCCRW